MAERGNIWLKPSLQEWLETDGLGGFASSTTIGIHTRRYHGWLFMAGADPGERWLCLSKLEDACSGPEGKWELSSNFYPGATYPSGSRNIWAFSKKPFPTFTFKAGKNFIEREIFMVKGMPGVFCVYRLKDGAGLLSREGFTLTLRPLCNSRFYHHTAKEGSWAPRIHCVDAGVVLEGHSCGDLALVCSRGEFAQDVKWYKNMLYPVERSRGLDYTEDHLSPGYFTTQIRPGEEVVFWAGPVSKTRKVASPLDEEGLAFSEFCTGLRLFAAKHRNYELARRHEVGQGGAGDGNLGDLCLAADQFVINTGRGTSIIAGYHWFGEWGRDTFISVPGILLHTGKFAQAREVFLRFGQNIRNGLIPNRFEEGQGAAYNSADASLWFIDALDKYEKASGDWDFVKMVLPVAGEIIKNYIQGTDWGIKLASSGLLAVGTEDTQLTWMDACVAGCPVTPRGGFPVEINALWVRALTLYGTWLERQRNDREKARASTGHIHGLNMPGDAGDEGTNPRLFFRLAMRARKEFMRLFVWPGVGLYDRIDEDGPVPEIRPNQIIAGSIRELGLPRYVLFEIWDTAFRKLLSPHGVRTLAPYSANYRGSYAGGPGERDSAYHQGTAWPWLLGPFFDLSVRLLLGSTAEYSGETRIGDTREGGKASRLLSDGPAHLAVSHILRLDSNPCVGNVFEVASGDPPFEAGGAVAQAWSVAEMIRIVSYLSGTPRPE